MVRAKLGAEVDSDYPSLFENSSMSSTGSSSSSSPCYQNEDICSEGGREMKRKVKKLRSIKLARLPSLKLGTSQSTIKSGDVSVLSSDAASSHHSRMSPNYMRTTTSSNAKKENLQKSARTLARRSSFKPAKSLTRLSSSKFRRPLARKSSGGTDLKKKLKKSRSIKIANRSSMVLASDADIPPHFSNTTDRFDGRNVQLQASLHNFESALSGNDDDDKRKVPRNSKSKIASPGTNSMKVMTRTSTLRPLRILTKVASLRTKRPSMKKLSQIPESGIQKATCSSAIKDSKFPDHLGLQPEGRESEGNSAMKVCPYSYCSLHGHHHSDVPPLKRFVSIRRRLLKNQKSMKSASRSSRRVKRSGNAKKGTQTSQLVSSGDSAVLETSHDKIAVSSSIGKTAGSRAESTKEGAHGGDDKDTSNVTSVTDIQILQEEDDEGWTANLNLDVFKIDSHSNTARADASTSLANEQLNKARRLNQNRVAESRDINNMVSFASIGKPLLDETAASEENNQDVQNYRFLSEDSEHRYATDVSHETQKEKQKHMGLWNLIYQHMATGIATENGAQPHASKKAKEEEEDEKTLPGINKSGSFLDFSSTDQSNDEEDHDERSGKIHQYQSNAISLVQEAFDRILAEIPDQSSDDQSITSDTSDKELAVKDQSEDGQLNILASYGSDGDSIVQEQEKLRLKTDYAFEREKAQSRVESKSSQQMPKGWSNLKKILILKRFVKALEKVRNFNPRKARYLHAEAEPGSEKVHLRHQTFEERRNSEEWMLDHALQQVISTLVPAQKRKVALLVRAFETITPLTEVDASPRVNIEASYHTIPVKTCNGASDCNRSIEGKETIFGIPLRKTSSLDTSFKQNLDQANDFNKVEEHIQDSQSELKETSFENGCIHTASTTSSLENTVADMKNEFVALNLGNDEINSIIEDNEPDFVDHCWVEDTESKLCDKSLPKTADALRTSTGELVINEEVLPEDAEGASSASASEVYDRDSELSSQNSDTNNQNNRTCDESDEPDSQTPQDNVVSSSTVSAPVEESSEVAGEENRLKNKFLQGSNLLHESETGCTTNVAHEKQKHMKFWFLIYKHMVSGNATLLEGADKEEQGDDGNTLVEMKTSENDDADNQKIKLQKMEAIRLVEEAIDQIPLPEIQDDAPDSVASDIIQDQDQEYIEKKHKEGEKPFISSSFECTNDSFGESDNTEVEESTTVYRQESLLNFGNIIAQEKTKLTPTAGNKPKPAVQKNWSNLKKVILLKRFVKALEKVKKFNQQEPRFLPMDPLSEAEKVHLRHQDTDDRKNADEWMLDYALRQVVAKLTPARKRKVSLLVEAFEAVTPIGSGEWSDTCSSSPSSYSVRRGDKKLLDDNYSFRCASKTC